MLPRRMNFWCFIGHKWTPRQALEQKVREVIQKGFWNILSNPTFAPSLSRIGWPQILTSRTLSQTGTRRARIISSSLRVLEAKYLKRKGDTTIALFRVYIVNKELGYLKSLNFKVVRSAKGNRTESKAFTFTVTFHQLFTIYLRFLVSNSTSYMCSHVYAYIVRLHD